MKIKIPELKEVACKELKNNVYSGIEIPALKNVMLYAQLRGNNQDVVKLTGNCFMLRTGFKIS